MRELFAHVRFRLDHRWAPDRFSAHLDGQLPAPERDRMERHLGECVECRRVLAGLTAVVRALHQLPSAQPARTPTQFVAAVRVQLGDSPGDVS
jgi:anti-sigma factor RsiW